MRVFTRIKTSCRCFVPVASVVALLSNALGAGQAAGQPALEIPERYYGLVGSLSLMDLSQDGTKLVIGGTTAKLMDAQTLEELQTFFGSVNVRELAISANGSRVITTGGLGDATARVFNADTGEIVADLEGHTSFVNAVALSNDGTRALTGSSDSTARLWNAESGTEIASFPVAENVNRIRFSPDEDSAVLALADRSAIIIPLDEVDPDPSVFQHLGAVNDAQLSSDQTQLLTAEGAGGNRNVVLLWDTEDNQELSQFNGHTGPVGFARFSSDETLIYSLATASDPRIRIWNPSTQAQIRTISQNFPDSSSMAPIRSARLSPDNARMYGGVLQNLFVWDAVTGAVTGHVQPHTAGVNKVAFSPDGERIATAGGDFASWSDDTVRVWDTHTGEQLLMIDAHDAPVNAVTFSPDGTRLLSTGGWGDETARVWSADTGAEMLVLEGHEASVNDAAFSPNGTQIVTGAGDFEEKEFTARLWDAHSGDLIHVLSGHTNAVSSVAFSPNGDLVLTGANDNTARLWQSSDGSLVRVFDGHTNDVRSVAFSPDGATVLTGALDGTARLWDTATGALIRTLEDNTTSTWLRSVAYSPDGARILTTSGGIGAPAMQVWDRTTGSVLATIRRVAPVPLSAVFSPDGTKALVGGNDSLPTLWDLTFIDDEPEPSLLGDINGDGVVNAVDVQLAINAALGIDIDPAFDADINDDNFVNAVDVQLVINAALGISISGK